MRNPTQNHGYCCGATPNCAPATKAVKKVREEADKIPWDEIAMQAKDRGISMKHAAVETGVSRSISLKEAAEDVPWHKISERARTTGVSMKLGCILLGC